MSSGSRQSLAFVCGDDDFEVKVQCQRLLDRWRKESPGVELEVVEGQSGHLRGTLDRIAAVRAALETFSLFGSGKLVWFRHCNFLSEGRLAASKQVGEAVEGLLASLKECDWKTTRFLISAPGVNKRRHFYKWLRQAGEVISCESLVTQSDAESVALNLVEGEVQRSSKMIRREVAEFMVRLAGLNRRTLVSECEKAILHSGDSREVALSDIQATISPARQAKAFAFIDAVAERRLERALECLEDELWSVKTDRQGGELMLLYGLVSKFRNMLLIKDLMRRGLLQSERSFAGFRSQFNSLDASRFPADRRFSLLAQHPYTVFQAVRQADRYRESELIRILEMLMESNRRMVSVSIDPASVLRECVMRIMLSAADGGLGRG